MEENVFVFYANRNGGSDCFDDHLFLFQQPREEVIRQWSLCLCSDKMVSSSLCDYEITVLKNGRLFFTNVETEMDWSEFKGEGLLLKKEATEAAALLYQARMEKEEKDKASRKEMERVCLERLERAELGRLTKKYSVVSE